MIIKELQTGVVKHQYLSVLMACYPMSLCLLEAAGEEGPWEQDVHRTFRTTVERMWATWNASIGSDIRMGVVTRFGACSEAPSSKPKPQRNEAAYEGQGSGEGVWNMPNDR